ncbi:hypothetical protein [Streptomyces sp. KLOTTS4A1]|uniref:hypothetical protein n=1 Tax=Streptomyces sp. KLOTTS4A1 TaxID=3390996 RepID=UPI0039F5EB53
MTHFPSSAAEEAGQWFYCLKHESVEEGPACRAADRLGPYASSEEAARAIETARKRTTQWESDPRWQDGEEKNGGTNTVD